MRIPSRAWITAAALSVLAPAHAADAPGFRLGDAARPIAYDWQLAIDPKEPAFTGEVRIEVELRREMPVLWLNATGLTVEAVEVHMGDRRIEASASTPDEDHIGIASRGGSFPPGRATVTLRYRGPIEPISFAARAAIVLPPTRTLP